MPKGIALVRVEEILASRFHIMAHLGQTRTQILDKLDQILHGLNHLRDGQVVQHLLAVAAEFSNLKKLKKLKKSLDFNF